jgi:HEPN domain-containing protein
LKDEAEIWLEYSKENFESANILLKSSLFNPCLQNVQQSIEKALKAVLVEKDIGSGVRPQ